MFLKSIYTAVFKVHMSERPRENFNEDNSCENERELVKRLPILIPLNPNWLRGLRKCGECGGKDKMGHKHTFLSYIGF